jgi:hypothetical protein
MATSEIKMAVVSAEVDVNAIAIALAAPFDAGEVRFKPQTVSGNRALAVPFVDARVIQDRLDDVLGVMGWQDNYECLPEGSVVCRLSIRLGSEWITKMDVGGQSEQPDEGDRRKAAFSDALKRAAVKFGIGRYLYRLKPQWVDFDPQKRQFVRRPSLPSPGAAKNANVEKKGEKAKMEVVAGVGQEARPSSTEGTGAGTGDMEKAVPVSSPQAPARGMPANGPELQRRLYDYDDRLAKQGLCKPGDLVRYVVEAGNKAGYEKDLSTWSPAAIHLAIEETRAFEARLREPVRKEVA